MKKATLKTDNLKVMLIEPDVERDAALGVQWLEGKIGRETLKMMGVIDADNKPSTLEIERKRVKEFITRDDQLNWMIEYDRRVVGAVWVDLEPTDHLPSPAVHIMIGDPTVRGLGVGTASFGAVLKYLKESNYSHIYSRHLLENEASTKLLQSFGFKNLNEAYEDSDGLQWQNVSLTV